MVGVDGVMVVCLRDQVRWEVWMWAGRGTNLDDSCLPTTKKAVSEATSSTGEVLLCCTDDAASVQTTENRVA
jgi:hypothetical protein